MTNNLLITAVTPHPPLIIPEVGGSEINRVKNTVNALENLSEKIVGLNPDTIVIITPHSVFNPYYFSIYAEETLRGNFARFRAPQVALEFENDPELVKNLKGTNPLPKGVMLDHGSLVPLYYLHKAGYKNKVTVINYTAMGKQEHKAFGKIIKETAQASGRKIALIASGDLSHKLIPGAPAGYDENAHLFDELIVNSIKTGNYAAIEEITSNMRETAGECGYNSLMVAIGAVEGKPQNNEILSYEGPFGVGYLVGVL